VRLCSCPMHAHVYACCQNCRCAQPSSTQRSSTGCLRAHQHLKCSRMYSQICSPPAAQGFGSLHRLLAE
jgi:hypothetical protein